MGRTVLLLGDINHLQLNNATSVDHHHYDQLTTVLQLWQHDSQWCAAARLFAVCRLKSHIVVACGMADQLQLTTSSAWWRDYHHHHLTSIATGA